MRQKEIEWSFTIKAAEEVRKLFNNEKEVSTEHKLTFNQYDYTPKQLAELQHQENVYVCDIETFTDEEKRDCEPYAV